MLDVLYSLRDSVWIVFCRYQLNVKTAGGEMWHAVSPTSSKLSVPCHNVKTRRCWIWTFSFTWFSCKLCPKGGVETQPDIPKSLSVNRKCFMYLFLPYVSLGSIFTVNDPLNKHVICIFFGRKTDWMWREIAHVVAMEGVTAHFVTHNWISTFTQKNKTNICNSRTDTRCTSATQCSKPSTTTSPAGKISTRLRNSKNSVVWSGSELQLRIIL